MSDPAPETYPSQTLRMAQDIQQLRAENEALLLKIDQVSRSCRSQLMSFGFVILAAAMTFFAAHAMSAGTSAKASPEIRTQSLVLVDDQARTRGFFGLSKDGYPAICLYNNSGVNTLRLVTSEDGSGGLYVYNASGKRLFSSTGGTGNPDHSTIMMLGADGTEQFALGITDLGVPQLIIRDSKGIRRLGLGIKKDGSSSIDLANSKGIDQLSGVVREDGSANLMIRDSLRQDRANVGISPDGSASARVFDSSGSILFDSNSDHPSKRSVVH
jgi:hypothetical protein